LVTTRFVSEHCQKGPVTAFERLLGGRDGDGTSARRKGAGDAPKLVLALRRICQGEVRWAIVRRGRRSEDNLEAGAVHIDQEALMVFNCVEDWIEQGTECIVGERDLVVWNITNLGLKVQRG
jgi:hypothetical protein